MFKRTSKEIQEGIMRISRASAGCAEGENNAVTAPWSDPHREIKQLLRGLLLSGFGMFPLGAEICSHRILSKPDSEQSGTSVCKMPQVRTLKCPSAILGVTTYGSEMKEKSENTLILLIPLLMEMIERRSYAMQTVRFWSYHKVPLPSSMAQENSHSAHSI